MMEHAPYNIVILPPKEIAERAMLVSKELANVGSFFVLDQKQFLPHITLYMVELPSEHMAMVKDALKHIASELLPLQMEQTVYRHVYDGYVDVAFAKTPNLMRLQERIIETVNPLREGLLRATDRERFDSLPTEEQAQLNKYGFRSIGHMYAPHLTLSRLTQSNPDSINQLTPRAFSFSATTLALTRIASHGTCPEILETFSCTS